MGPDVGRSLNPSFSSLMRELLHFVRPSSPNSRSARRDWGYTIGPSPRRSFCVTKRLFMTESAIVVVYFTRSVSFTGPSLPLRIPMRVLPASVNSMRLEPPVFATRLVSAFCSSRGSRSTAQTSPTRRMSRVSCAHTIREQS